MLKFIACGTIGGVTAAAVIVAAFKLDTWWTRRRSLKVK